MEVNLLVLIDWTEIQLILTSGKTEEKIMLRKVNLVKLITSRKDLVYMQESLPHPQRKQKL